MWTAQQSRRESGRKTAAADCGQVTCSEEQAGVYLDGDRRWMDVYSPGGYSWRPAAGEEVLVLKTGSDQESACIAGRKQEKNGLDVGEVCIYSSKGGRITLRNNGEINLDGSVFVGGTALRSYIANIVELILRGD